MKVSILGAGSWATALSIVLNDNNHEVMLWTRNSSHAEFINTTRENSKYLPGVKIGDKTSVDTKLDKVAKFGDVIIIAVASQSVREVLKNTDFLIDKKKIIVNVSKGVEIGTLNRISEVVSEFYPENDFVALSGPSHAEEVAKGIPTTLVASSENILAAEYIQDLFSNDAMRVYTNDDIIGVELGGALKNIIALGAGISDGLGFGDNTKAAIMTRGIKEISLLGVTMGASYSTFSGLSGIGDLIVTCTSVHSRNRRCGILIGEGVDVKSAIEKIGMVVEGIYTIKSAYDLSQKYNVEMPITRELYKVIYENANPKNSVINLMTRQKKHEIEDVIK